MLQEDKGGDQHDQLWNHQGNDARDQIGKDNLPVVGTVGSGRLDVGRLLHLKKDRPISLDAGSKDAEKNDEAQHEPDTT
jgi:hypothetical protein